MITNVDYNYPLVISKGYFNGRTVAVPPFPDYLSYYHVHFMRYIYYLCIMNAKGNYPNGLSIEEILKGFELNKGKICEPRITKILIGEAPPPNPMNYFYNPTPLRWNPTTGNPSLSQTWTSAIKNSLFPGMAFPDTVSFLEACAREGFLLLDLFPYAIKYSGRGNANYSQACISSWGVGPTTYPHNIINTLNYLICYIQKTIAIGFALTSFGRIILFDVGAVGSFNAWCLANAITLDPPGPLDQIRVVAPLVPPNASKYLRICHRRPMLSPCSTLLKLAGI
ncbi:hypothetical protein EWU23_00255 [Cytophagaceae bacterium 50C-KIRBA]|uniref:Uncharacterized protein n=1 Tax=Aquirufa beregesia TaxID=2516556 RepID=A0ABX0ES95_9BACT|nr:hypothetical protein [Aquirufa beregesia]NGZ42901.1 hypothetical protein [Aquirufa beregesia]